MADRKYPKFIIGHTYRLTFTPNAERIAAAAAGGPRYQAEVARPFVTEWTVCDWRPETAGALRAYIMRWTTRGANTAEVVDITPEGVYPHGLRTVSPEGDGWQARCIGCSWVSQLCDTKAEARAEHSDHDLAMKLRPHLGLSSPKEA